MALFFLYNRRLNSPIDMSSLLVVPLCFQVRDWSRIRQGTHRNRRHRLCKSKRGGQSGQPVV